MEEDKKIKQENPINRRNSVQKSVYIKPSTNESILKYISKKEKEDGRQMYYSEVVNIALEDFFKVEATSDSLELTTKIIDKCVEKHIKKYFDRIIALQSKNTKTSYTSIYLLAKLLAVLYQSDDERDFVREEIKEADELAYKATTKYSLKNDLQNLIPKDLDF